MTNLGSRKLHICPKVTKMRSIIGHRIDYNGVGALRGPYSARINPSTPPPPSIGRLRRGSLNNPFLATTARVLDVEGGLDKGRGNWEEKKRDSFPLLPPLFSFSLFLPATQPVLLLQKSKNFLPLSNLYLNTLSKQSNGENIIL